MSNPSTFDGMLLALTKEPSWPHMLLPQHQTVPSASTAHVCLFLAARATATAIQAMCKVTFQCHIYMLESIWQICSMIHITPAEYACTAKVINHESERWNVLSATIGLVSKSTASRARPVSAINTRLYLALILPLG